MKKVLITGGSRGIGAACVRKFAESGDYRVYFNYAKNDAAAKQLMEETGAAGFKCSVTNVPGVKKMADIIGDIDILVNNAGISKINLFTDITEKEWDEVFNVNIKGMFIVTKTFMPGMIRKKYGRIVNISSMWGISGGSCEVHYSSAKAAVIGFTKALAKEEGLSGITVNCCAPGVIRTDMNSRLDGDTIMALEEDTALGRIGTPEDVAEAVYFLASDNAAFITGQVLQADGGIIM